MEYYKKSELVGATVWPISIGQAALIFLVSDEGEVFGEFEIKKAISGQELIMLCPDNFSIMVENAQLLARNSKVIRVAKSKFDTAVVTEKRERTLEERLYEKLKRDMIRREQSREQSVEVIEPYEPPKKAEPVKPEEPKADDEKSKLEADSAADKGLAKDGA